MEGENKKSEIKMLYNAALKRGFDGTFGRFCEEYNGLMSKTVEGQTVEPSKYFEDTGEGAVSTNTQQQQPPVQQNQQSVQQPVYEQRPNPIPEPLQPKKAASGDDGKILGMNKWVFGGLCVLGVVAVIGGSVMIYRSLKKSPGGSAGASSSVRPEIKTTETQQAVPGEAAKV